MTVAGCFGCGELKLGAFSPCNGCNKRPVEDEDAILSLAMTDHYFDRPTLMTMAAKVKRGERMNLDDATRAQLLTSLKAFKATPAARAIFGGNEPVRPAPKRRWWQFL